MIMKEREEKTKERQLIGSLPRAPLLVLELTTTRRKVRKEGNEKRW